MGPSGPCYYCEHGCDAAHSEQPCLTFFHLDPRDSSLSLSFLPFLHRQRLIFQPHNLQPSLTSAALLSNLPPVSSPLPSPHTVISPSPSHLSVFHTCLMHGGESSMKTPDAANIAMDVNKMVGFKEKQRRW